MRSSRGADKVKEFHTEKEGKPCLERDEVRLTKGIHAKSIILILQIMLAIRTIVFVGIYMLGRLRLIVRT